jgi:hypothetical protein
MVQSLLSRRSLLSGFGAASGAAVFASAMPASAAPGDPGRGGGVSLSAASAGAGPVPRAAFTPMTGRAYDVIDPTMFRGGAVSKFGVGGLTGTELAAPINLPLGAVLEEIVLQYLAPTAPGPTAELFKMTPGSIYGSVVPETTLPFGAGGLQMVTTLDEAIDGSASYMAFFIVRAAGQTVQGMRIGYRPPAAGFIANKPIPRVLDTRVSGGKLQNNEERVVATGIPTSALAAVINLTVTETEKGGFVAVFPANSTWPGNSSINWSSSGQNLANSVITATDPTGHIRIRGGVNPTHVVIDVQGYFA